MLCRLLADYQLVAFQETKFTKSDNLRIVTSYINSADSRAQVFWSHRNDDDFTGHDGVALILSGRHPFTAVEDVTQTYASADHLARYLVLDARIDDFQVFIHVVYAPVDTPDRKRFFESLPTRFPDAANHLVLGDLNTPMDPVLDEASPYPHDLGRDELQTWMLELGVMDPWRATFPDRRLFSGPKQRNRIDYCLMTPELFDGYYRSSRYVTDKTWYHEDHYPVEIHLASPSQPTSKRLPWKCPRWLLQVPIVRETLDRTLECFCDRLRLFPGGNPGALLDRHKADDLAFLKSMQQALKNKDDERLANLRAAVRMARALDTVSSTDETRANVTKALGDLKALQDLFADRREKTKFDRDVTEGERGSAYFFRSPTNSSYRVSIPNVTLPNGTSTSDPDDMAAAHRHYWGSLYQSPSWDIKEKKPHHILAFADDCTGLLRDLRDAPVFVEAVRVYAATAGLRLNVHKTHIFPFSPLHPDLRAELEAGGWDVIADDGEVRVLGIYMSPSLPSSARFPRILDAMVLRCNLWRYRARTLQGRAVILRAIVLPLLWYTAAVTRVPENVAIQVKRLCKAFLFKRDISPTRVIRGPMAEEWLYMPTSLGGLGLPETVAFSRALQLCSLRDAMRAVTHFCTIPRWFAAAYSMLSGPLDCGGVGFDILYAPIPYGLTVQGPWEPLGAFWIEPLRAWYSLVVSHCSLDDFSWQKLEMPYWQNHFLRANASGGLTGKASSNAHRFFDAGYGRIHDFIDRHGQYPTRELCKDILGEANFATPDKWSYAAGFFSRQAARLLGLDVRAVPAIGPHLPAGLSAARHEWTFDKVEFVKGMNHQFYHLLHKLPEIKRKPHLPLGVAVEPLWKDLWKRERSLDRDLLPILADIKFRLQHNGLNVRKKYKHQTSDVLCVHGCSDVEDAEHLFWTCPVARAAWDFFLPDYQSLLQPEVTWAGVVYLQGMVFQPTALLDFGSHNLLRVFNVLRCSVLYMLWLHHNDCMMNGTSTNKDYVIQRAKAYVRLHLLRMSRADNPRLRCLCQRWVPDPPGGRATPPVGNRV
ncbi:putative pollike protein [Phytophthora cinnamomi]|uniref:putative pollike protein n=1 Tax=Phytophthora cinnamomi TaxID=4785 RepID=UPI0035596C93|nr:putative pollike protein [Phytophthora cinnamomi]